MATSAEMLEQVDAAISALVTGKTKAYSIGDRSVTRNNLGELRELRADLQREVAAAGGNVICKSGFDR